MLRKRKGEFEGTVMDHTLPNPKRPRGYLKDSAEGKFAHDLYASTDYSGNKKERSHYGPKIRTGKFEKQKYEQMLEQVNFQDVVGTTLDKRQYVYDTPLVPFMFFYKFLAKRPPEQITTATKRKFLSNIGKLQLWIPDTVVYGDTEIPFWIYSSLEGFVYKTETFIDKHIVNKMGNQFCMRELVALVKTAHIERGELIGNRVELLSTNALGNKLQGLSLVGGDAEICAIQKFVRSKGPNSFVCRSVWKRNQAPFVFIITNTKTYYDEEVEEYKRYIVNVREIGSCSIVKSVGGKHCEETQFYMKNLVNFLERNTKVHFNEIVGDFIRDECGTWWLVGIKAFKLEPDSVPQVKDFMMVISRELRVIGSEQDSSTMNPHRGKVPYSKVKICKFCQVGYPVQLLTHQLTFKMILQTEKQLKHLGHNLDWLDHGESSQFDTTSFYEAHNVCKSCYQLYQQIEELRTVELKFAKALGIPVASEANTDSLPTSSSTLDISRSRLLSRGDRGPDTERLGGIGGEEEEPIIETQPDQELIIQEPNLYRYRVLLILEELSDIPIKLSNKKNLTLSVRVFNMTQKIKLSSVRSLPFGVSIIPIMKFRMYYFFAQNMEDFHKCLEKHKNVFVRLTSDGQVLATVHFGLSDFHSEMVEKREYYSMMTGKGTTCYLRFSIGMSKCKNQVPFPRVPLKYFDGLLVPPDSYYACEKLPDEWVQMIPNIIEYNSQLERAYEFSALNSTGGSAQGGAMGIFGAGNNPNIRPDTSYVPKRTIPTEEDQKSSRSHKSLKSAQSAASSHHASNKNIPVRRLGGSGRRLKKLTGQKPALNVGKIPNKPHRPPSERNDDDTEKKMQYPNLLTASNEWNDPQKLKRKKKKKIVGKKKEKAKEMKEDELIDQKLKGEEEVSNEESKEYAFHCFKITINIEEANQLPELEQEFDQWFAMCNLFGHQFVLKGLTENRHTIFTHTEQFILIGPIEKAEMLLREESFRISIGHGITKDMDAHSTSISLMDLAERGAFDRMFPLQPKLQRKGDKSGGCYISMNGKYEALDPEDIKFSMTPIKTYDSDLNIYNVD